MNNDKNNNVFEDEDLVDDGSRSFFETKEEWMESLYMKKYNQYSDEYDDNYDLLKALDVLEKMQSITKNKEYCNYLKENLLKRMEENKNVHDQEKNNASDDCSNFLFSGGIFFPQNNENNYNENNNVKSQQEQYPSDDIFQSGGFDQERMQKAYEESKIASSSNIRYPSSDAEETLRLLKELKAVDTSPCVYDHQKVVDSTLKGCAKGFGKGIGKEIAKFSEP